VGSRGYAQRADARQLVERYLSAWVAVCVKRNAGGVAATPFRVYKRKGKASAFGSKRVPAWQHEYIVKNGSAQARGIAGASGDIEEIDDPFHPLVRLLLEVNPAINGYSLMYDTEAATSLTGNFYWVKIRGKQRGPMPTELWPVWAHQMRVLPSREGLIQGYEYGRGLENEMYLDPDSVVRFMKPNPFGDPFVGMGDLLPCLVEADLSSAFARYAASMIERGVSPSLIVKLQTSDETERLKIEASIRAKYQGYKKAGEPLVFGNAISPTGESKIDVEPIVMAAHEVGFLAGQSEQSTMSRISANFDVPIGMLTLEEKAVANAKMLMPLWQTQSLVPRLMFMEEAINQYLVPDFREGLNEPTLFVAPDNPVDRDDAAQAERAVKLWSCPRPLVTLNETRAMIGMEPVEGGDELPEPIDKPAPGDAKGDKPKADDDAKDTKEKAVEDVWIITKAAPKDSEDEFASEVPPNIEAGMTPKRGFIRTIKRLYANLLAGVMDAVVSDTIEETDSAAIQFVLDEKGKAEFIDAVRDTFERGVETVSPEIDSLAEAVKYADTRSAALVTRVTDHTRETIRETIAEGVAQNKTGPEIARDLHTKLAHSFSPERAVVVAQTETSAAMNHGRLEAYRKSGVETKVWVLSGNPCQLCRSLAAMGTKPLDTPFARKGETVTAKDGKRYTVSDDIVVPPAHPNCACSFVEGVKP
jgi:hypothetical protein